MIGLFITLYTIVLVFASFVFLNNRYQLCEKTNIISVLKKHWKYLVLTTIVLVGILLIEIFYSNGKEMYCLPVLMRWSTIFWGTYLLAKIDYHEKKIPNMLVLMLIIVRVLFLIYELIVNYEFWQEVVMYPLLGGLIGGGIILIAMILSRSGIGMGDVKMLMAIGLYVGSTEILDTMFYMFLLSAIGGICLLIGRKAKIKDSIPMAPFAFAGVAMKYVLLMIGG